MGLPQVRPRQLRRTSFTIRYSLPIPPSRTLSQALKTTCSDKLYLAYNKESLLIALSLDFVQCTSQTRQLYRGRTSSDTFTKCKELFWQTRSSLALRCHHVNQLIGRTIFVTSSLIQKQLLEGECSPSMKHVNEEPSLSPGLQTIVLSVGVCVVWQRNE